MSEHIKSTNQNEAVTAKSVLEILINGKIVYVANQELYHSFINIRTKHIEQICSSYLPEVYRYLNDHESFDFDTVKPVTEYPLSNRQSITAYNAIARMNEGNHADAISEYIDCILNYGQTGDIDRELSKSEIVLLKTLTFALMCFSHK